MHPKEHDALTQNPSQKSDYQHFLEQSSACGRTDYPSVFQLLSISPLSDQQLSQTPLSSISPLDCTRGQLIALSVQMLMGNSFMQAHFDAQGMERLVTAIAMGYNPVSYHNFTHGFSLMQLLGRCFEAEATLRGNYMQEEVGLYLLASLGHDIRHPGNNNAYQVKMNTQRAVLAEGQSVLEKMHAGALFEICGSCPEFDVLGRSGEPAVAREKVLRAILATDMARHYTNLERLQQARKDGVLDLTQAGNKMLLIENLVHACDIGNGVLAFEQYLNWGILLTHEFNEQAKLQEQNNVLVSTFLKYRGIKAFYQDQVGFVGTFVVPLWREIAESLPELMVFSENGQANIKRIKQRIEQLQLQNNQ